MITKIAFNFHFKLNLFCIKGIRESSWQGNDAKNTSHHQGQGVLQDCREEN